MKRFSLLLAATLTAVTAHAATVNWSAQINTGLIDNSAAALASGNFIRIGYFGTLTDGQVASNSLSLAGIAILDADFKQFASTTIGTGTGGLAGSFATSSSPLYSTLPGFVPSSQIYFWALKATNNSSLANAVLTATETAIGYVPFATLSMWQFPASDLPPVKTIDIADFGNANRQVLAGSYVSTTSPSLNTAFGSPNFAVKLAPVPEPTALAFSAIAIVALAGSRRRSKGNRSPA